MSKRTFYFPHDYNSRSDPKLIKLSMKLGMEGIGIYWCIIEMLYEQDGYISLDNIESIAFELHSDSERITNVLRHFDLFRFDVNTDKFYSESVLKRLSESIDKSKKARESANAKWQKIRDNDANAMRTQCDGNAIKERKGKEIKRRKSIVFIPPIIEEVKEYFLQNGFNEQSAIKAFNSYNVAGWVDSKGNKILNWKQKMINVWFKDENKIIIQRKVSEYAEITKDSI